MALTAYQKEYKNTHKKQISEYYHKWYQKNKEIKKQYNYKYNFNMRRKKGARINKKYSSSKERMDAIRTRSRKYAQKIRLLVLMHYSDNNPVCVCCGERELKFLSIDHINGGGNKHRKSISKDGRGGNMSFWLYRHGFPSGFQVLCHNCNMAKGFYGQCPHSLHK